MGKAFLESTTRLMRRVPAKVWLAVGGLLVGAFWLQQHDARIRQQARLQQLRNQTSAQVAALSKQAAQDVKQANVENAKAIAKLEQRRQQAEQQNRQLAAKLARLRGQAQIQAGEVATLPLSEVVTRVATQLGLNSEDVAAEGDADIAKSPISAPAMNGHPEEPGLGGATKEPGSSNAAMGSVTRKKLNAGILRSAQDDGNAALALTSSGARKVETALVALNACRAESSIETQQITNCQARSEADEAAFKRQAGSIASLNQALEAKDSILARQQTECRAELRAARGTFLGRLAHAAEHIAIGLAMGVAIGVAVK